MHWLLNKDGTAIFGLKKSSSPVEVSQLISVTAKVPTTKGNTWGRGDFAATCPGVKPGQNQAKCSRIPVFHSASLPAFVQITRWDQLVSTHSTPRWGLKGVRQLGSPDSTSTAHQQGLLTHQQLQSQPNFQVHFLLVSQRRKDVLSCERG